MNFLVAYIVCGMSSLFLTLYVGNYLFNFVGFGHVIFFSLFSYLTGAFTMLATKEYLELSSE